jgi:internalin A
MASTIRAAYDNGGKRTEVEEHMVKIEYYKVSDIGDTLDRCLILRDLDFSNTQLFDLGPLSTLSTLRHLNLGYTKIRGIEDLKGLTQLEFLDLEETVVEDLSPLRELINLRHLQLRHTNIMDITALTNCRQLKTLDLYDTKIRDIRPLRGHTELTTLTISYTDIADIDVVSTLTGLDTLNASNCDMTDFSPISKLTKLETLDLSDTFIEDLSQLIGENQQLNFINICGTRVSTIAPLFDLPFIKTVYLPATIKLEIPMFPSHITGSITIGKHIHTMNVHNTDKR